VNIAAFDRVAIPALHEAVRRRDFLVIDEIGRMELASTAFVEALQAILESPIPLLATVHQAAHPVTDKLKQRSDVEVWTVRQNNRDALPDRLSTQLITAWQAKGRAHGEGGGALT
jgi:nucleoside-triphosphatase